MTSRIGPYEIRGELGRGAMAVVWHGFDPAIGREVAIKEPKIDDSLAQATRDELAARFIREGKTAGQLNHPGIVTIYNADIIDGRAVIVMELIEGETLGDILARGPLPQNAAIGITEQLLDALAYAHARGVVHRDIKPDNVFITDDGRVKLTDFGVAHVGTGTALTQAGTVMGTPGYMAPEQVRGEAVDARADLFAVGVMLHEMLTGANPFMAEDAHPTTIMYRVLNERLPDVRTALPDAPESLAATVAVATAKDASARFASAEEMRSALLGQVAVAMPRIGPQAVSSKRRSSVIVGVAIIVAATATFAWVSWPSDGGSVRSASVPVSAAVSEVAQDESEFDRDDYIQNLTDVLGQLNRERQTCEQEFYSRTPTFWNPGPGFHMNDVGWVDLDSGLITRLKDEVLSLGESPENDLATAASHIIAAADRMLVADDDIDNHRCEGEASWGLAAARYHLWAAETILTEDSQGLQTIASLEAASEKLPSGLDIWFPLRVDGGRLEVSVDGSGPTARYGAKWAYEDDQCAGGRLAEPGERPGEYQLELYGTVVFGQMKTFPNANGPGTVYWTEWYDPRRVDENGYPSEQPCGSYSTYPRYPDDDPTQWVVFSRD